MKKITKTQLTEIVKESFEKTLSVKPDRALEEAAPTQKVYAVLAHGEDGSGHLYGVFASLKMAKTAMLDSVSSIGGNATAELYACYASNGEGSIIDRARRK